MPKLGYYSLLPEPARFRWAGPTADACTVQPVSLLPRPARYRSCVPYIHIKQISVAVPQQGKNRNIFVLPHPSISCWEAPVRRPGWVRREGRLWRAGARHTAPSLCRLLWLLSCSVQESNILFCFSLRRNAFDAVHHVLFYNAKARCLKQRAFCGIQPMTTTVSVSSL